MTTANSDRLWDSLQRITRVGVAVEIGAASLCADHVRSELGIAAWVRQDPDKIGGRADRINTRFHLIDDKATVMWVIPGRAGDRAGLREGDLVDKDLLLDVYATWIPGLPREVALVRDGISNTVTATPDGACVSTLSLQTTDAIDAYADGTMIRVTEGTVEFVENDDELAFMIAHELAHNLRHRAAIEADRITKEMESEADYLALYIMALGRFDYRKVPALFQRFAVQAPFIGFFNHPSTQEREAALRQTIAEIDGKKARGEPLTPREPLTGK